MRTVSRSLAFRLTAIGVGVVAGLAWIVVADDDPRGLRDAAGPPTTGDRGRTLTAVECAAHADCVSVGAWKRGHDGFPPPYLLVKPVGGGPVERLPFAKGWRLAEAGEVWTHRACARRRPGTSSASGPAADSSSNG